MLCVEQRCLGDVISMYSYGIYIKYSNGRWSSVSIIYFSHGGLVVLVFQVK